MVTTAHLLSLIEISTTTQQMKMCFVIVVEIWSFVSISQSVGVSLQIPPTTYKYLARLNSETKTLSIDHTTTDRCICVEDKSEVSVDVTI